LPLIKLGVWASLVGGAAGARSGRGFVVATGYVATQADRPDPRLYLLRILIDAGPTGHTENDPNRLECSYRLCSCFHLTHSASIAIRLTLLLGPGRMTLLD